MQDPATFLNRHDLRVPCIVDPTRPARIEGGGAVVLNWEVFFFCDDEARERFLQSPLRWCGVLTDPVTLQRFVPEASSPSLQYDGRTYYFGDLASRDRFAAEPQRYFVVPHYMLGETRGDVEERERKRREKNDEEEDGEGRT